MATFFFESISEAQAAAFNSANDTLVFGQAGETAAGTIVVSYDEATGATRLTSGLTGKSVVFGNLSLEQPIFPDSSVLTLGSAGSDSLQGSANHDRLLGAGGADTLSGLSGADVLEGGSGDDRLIGGAGRDSLTGGAGADTFVFNATHSGVSAAAIDTITDWGAGDRLAFFNAATSADYVETTAADYAAALAAANTQIAAGKNFVAVQVGADVILFADSYGNNGSADDAILLSGRTLADIDAGSIVSGADFVAPPAGAGDTVSGTSGDDTLTGEALADSLSGDAGADVLSGRGGNDTLNGGAGNDVILGDDGNDSIVAAEGADTVDGGVGNDVLIGGDGGDSLTGGFGNDGLDGRDGDDVLFGGIGVDTYLGGAGNDVFRFSHGDGGVSIYALDRIMDWEAGDTLSFVGGSTAVDGVSYLELTATSYDSALALANGHIAGGSVNYLVIQIGADLVLFADTAGDNGAADDAIVLAGRTLSDISAANFGQTVAVPQTVTGTAGADTLSGTTGADTIIGLDGADLLSGASGDDTLNGGDNADTLTGGSGADTLDGGAGDDRLYSGNASPSFNLPYSSLPYVLPQADTGSERDSLIGGAGSDRIFAGYGDHVDGGADGYYGDYLFISFMGAPSGVTADFGLSSQTIGGGLITSIENVSYIQGSQFGDNLNARSTGTGYSDFNAVSGMGGNDTLTAGYYTGSLFGDDGDDVVDGRPSQYLFLVEGGAGNDTLYAPSDPFGIVNGGAGADTIYASAAVHGDAGNDTIVMQVTNYSGGTAYGDEGDDQMTAASSGNRLFGGDGADTLTGGSGDDSLSGDSGADSLIAGGGANTLAGGAGADVMVGSATAGDLFVVGAGESGLGSGAIDAIHGWGAGDRLSLGGPAMTANNYAENTAATFQDALTLANGLIAGGTIDYVAVGVGSDLLIFVDSASNNGAAEDAIILRGVGVAGFSSADILTTAGPSPNNPPTGGQTITAHGASDNIVGGSGADCIAGGGGNDDIQGLAGADTVDAGDGVDYVQGGAGDDLLEGGSGVDTLSYLNAAQLPQSPGTGVVVNLANATVQNTDNGQGVDTQSGFENIDGSLYNDTLTGDGQDNLLRGWGGSDSLSGGGGADTLDGRDGDDTLSGGEGADSIQASIGVDSIYLGAGADTAWVGIGTSGVALATLDTILDWSSEDRLRFGYVAGTYHETTAADFNAATAAANGLIASGARYVAVGVGADVFVFADSAANGGVAEDAVKLAGRTLADISVTNLGSLDAAATLPPPPPQPDPPPSPPPAPPPSGGGGGGGGVSGDIFPTPEERGSASDDVRTLPDGQFSYDGGGGSDMIVGNAASNLLFGGDGDDTVSAGAGSDTVVGGEGRSYLRGDEGDDRMIGGSEFDDINGNMGQDSINGGAGDDWVVGGKDNDQIFGEQGKDLVYGNIGDDILGGGVGDDVVRGGQGNDICRGDDGNDYVSGDRGNDTMDGGLGADILHTFAEAGLDLVINFNARDGDRVMVDPGTIYTVSQVGADVVIDMGGDNRMILQNVELSTLPEGWIFGA